MTANLEQPLTCEVPVLFTSIEGQTALIAIRLATVLHEHGFDSEAIDMAGPDAARLDWTRVRGALVGASIHRQKHQPAAGTFVHAHVADLNRMPSAFFSVSLSAASKNPHEVQAAEQLARAFPAAHNWRPHKIVSVAGRLAYREYGFFIRLVMKWIARKEGAPTDTSRDYELTDWKVVDQLGHDMAALIHRRRTDVA
jgi:menaquinone-dependent protoporphyrinogen oxidase